LSEESALMVYLFLKLNWLSWSL